MRAATVKLWALHLVANAAVVAGAYFWLGIGDASALQLAATLLIGLLLVAFTVWLHGAVFTHFREPGLPLAQAFRTALRRLPLLILVAVFAAALYWALGWLLDHAYSPASNTASWLTLHLRRPVRPALILTIITWKVRVVEWWLVPALLLPLVAGIAGTPAPFARLRQLTFWIGCPVLLLLTLYVPWRLIRWVPYDRGLGLEMASFVLRWLIAWLLFVTAWFAVVALAGGRALRPSSKLEK
jgi:hypothetical protein